MKLMDAFKLKTGRWFAAGMMILAAFAAGALWRGGRDDGRRHEPVASGAPDARTQMFYCSMHPQVRSPDPDDKCPICFMDLIPLPDDDDDGDDGDVPRLRLSPRAAALMEIRTLPVERREAVIDLALFGTIDFDQSRIHNVPVRTDAYVTRLLVNQPWQPVAMGEVLAELYSPAAVTAMRELLVARGAAGDGLLTAARARLRRMGVTDGQIAEIERQGVAPREFRVASPAAGVVLEVTARTGDRLREGALLTRIADPARLWVNLEAYERDLPWIAPGQPARFTPAALPGRVFEGTVAFIDPVVDRRTRTVRLRVEADNPDGLLKPGMYVTAAIQAVYQSEDRTPPLVIPVSAPLITGRRALVYVRVAGEDRPVFEPRQVKLGPRAGDVYVVWEGLAAGDLVVVNGQFKMDSELQLRGRPSMMAAESAAPATHAHDHAAAAPRLQTECPVMGGAINTDYYVDVEGYRIYVCCPGCDRTILENPSAYIEKMQAAGVTPYRLQTHCPVMGGAINRDFHHDHDGRRIYVCCPACLEEVRERADAIIDEQRQQGVVFESVEAKP